MIADLSTPPSLTLTPEDVVREVKNLPSAPKVLPRLKQLLGDGNSAMHEIVALVRLDPGIAARVLQTANSAYFSKGVRCVTVDEAVHRVGYDQVYELVSYAVASQVLVRPLEVYGVDADELWRMSVACALAAETLAERSGQDRNVAYTIGLLHCVGMVAIDEWALRNARTLALTTMGFPREATPSERAQLGFTQAEAGGALLAAWEFPSAMSEPVRWQYTPLASGGYQRMACLLHAAKWLRSAVCAPIASERPPLPEAVQLQPIGLTPAALKNMVTIVLRRLSEVSSLLDVGETRVDTRSMFPAQTWRS
ncbi:MAG TPA: HDOD domain-containing protein [Opitutaceae bacterium]|nr:HDOD domain-containing protein [Opitutaceae bacterium]